MQNRVVMITGASAGIGAATAKRLARSSRLVLVARRRERLADLAAAIGEEGGEATVIAADLADPAAPAQVVAEAVERCGGLDVLVNNAGIFRTRPNADIDAEFVDQQLALNLRAPMLLAQAATPHLSANGGGWLVNISSIAADNAFPTCGVYGATKAGIELWSRVVREELRDQGVRVAVVAPGPTISEAWGDNPPPPARCCRAEDVAEAIATCLDQAPTANIDRLVITPPAGPL